MLALILLSQVTCFLVTSLRTDRKNEELIRHISLLTVVFLHLTQCLEHCSYLVMQREVQPVDYLLKHRGETGLRS